MKCEQVKEYLQKFIDGELDDKQSQEVEDHIKACPLCGLEHEQEMKLDSMIRNHIVQEKAPFELRERVVDALENTKRKINIPILSWLKPFPTVLVTACLVMVFTFTIFSRTANSFPLFSTSVNSHVDYLQGRYPMEIVSGDKQEVEHWFKGKLDFVVKIPALCEKNFKLTGARICHLKDKKVAFLNYKKDEHDISVFLMDTKNVRIPDSKKFTKEAHTFYVKDHKGYRSVLCLTKTDKSTGCIFVTDLSEKEFLDLLI